VAAATAYMGLMFVEVDPNRGVAVAFWAFAVLLWGLLLYSFLTAMVVVEPKPGVEKGINGDWLGIVVATQTASLLAAYSSPFYDAYAPLVLFFSLGTLFFGAGLYLLFVPIIDYRLSFFKMSRKELSPSYWLLLSSAATTATVAAVLARHAPEWPFLATISPFLKGFSMLFWGAASGWVPLMFIIYAWRFLVWRAPLKYDPRYWDAAYALGVYALASIEISKSETIDFLRALPQGFVFVALAVWLAVLAGLVRNIVSSFLRAWHRRGTPRGSSHR
ncbi:MAG: tellurite resistance/C4-dicarboxylate transporter family protein, partial [Chloroflexota bacterium]